MPEPKGQNIYKKDYPELAEVIEELVGDPDVLPDGRKEGDGYFEQKLFYEESLRKMIYEEAMRAIKDFFKAEEIKAEYQKLILKG